MSTESLYSLPAKTLEGKDADLSSYAGKVTLVRARLPIRPEYETHPLLTRPTNGESWRPRLNGALRPDWSPRAAARCSCPGTA